MYQISRLRGQGRLFFGANRWQKLWAVALGPTRLSASARFRSPARCSVYQSQSSQPVVSWRSAREQTAEASPQFTVQQAV